MVLEKKIFKFRQYIFHVFKLSPLGIGVSFEQTEIPVPKDDFVPSATWMTEDRGSGKLT